MPATLRSAAPLVPTRIAGLARVWPLALPALLALAAPPLLPGQAQATIAPAAIDAPTPGRREIPYPDLSTLEPEVAEQIGGLQGDLDALLAAGDAPPQKLVEAYGELGRLYHAYDLAEAAEACYANVEALDPSDPRWPYLWGQLLQAAGRFEEAAAAYRRAQELAPERLAVLYHLAEVEIELERPETARELLGRLLELAPELAAAQALLGDMALREKRYQEAVDLLETALAAVPNANRLHYPLGLAYRGLGDLDEARRHLARSGTVGVRPPDPWLDELEDLKTGERVHLLRGRRAFQAGDFQAAAQAFRQAVESRPDSTRARVNLGSALGQLGDRQGALEQYREALKLEPDNTTARFNLGVLLLAEGAAAEAVEPLTRVVAAAPDDAEARRQLGTALIRTGELEPALPHLRRAVELAPAEESARLAETEVLRALGRFSEMRQRLEEAQAAMPDSGQIAHALALLLAACPDPSLRDGERALELAQRVFAARRTVEHAETVALALAELGRCEEAAGWQQQAAEAARRLERPDLAAALEEEMERYQAGPPCRPEVGAGPG